MSTTTTIHSPLYTVDQYFGLVAAGQLDEDARVELLEGVIINMSPETPLHGHGIRLAQLALERSFPGREVLVQRSFLASNVSGPEPDIVVAPGATSDYRDRHPSQALLIVEVALSSLPTDRLTKSRIYAGAGVPEYWIVNVVDGALEVYRSPDAESRTYREVKTLGPDDTVTALHGNGEAIPVSTLLP